MSRLLVINSSPMGDQSATRQLTATFAQKYQESRPQTQVVERDVSALNLPHLDGEILGAFFTPAQERTQEQNRHVQRSEELIAEFKDAEAVVIGAPMHNFGIPSTLKAYIDHIARAGETFKYTENGPVGLVADKPVYLVAARGGDYSENGLPHMDFVLPYLQTVMGFIGIQNVKQLQANGLAMGEEAAQAAIAQVKQDITQALAA